MLSLDEAAQHPHNKARNAFVTAHGVEQVAPTPRFSRTAPALDLPPPEPGEHTDSVLAEFGFSAADIANLRTSKAVF